MNNHVSFELAKLLKEKKFHKSLPSICFIKEESNYTSTMVYEVFDVDFEYILRPTIADVVMWLYEKHGIWISVDSNPENGLFYYCIRKKLHRLRLNETVSYFTTPDKAYEEAIKRVLTKST